MKKLSLAFASGLLALCLSLPAKALDFSGYIDMLPATFLQDDADAVGPGGSLALVQGGRLPNQTDFDFTLETIALRLDHEFAERMRVHAELAFGRRLSNSNRVLEVDTGVTVREAYLTLGALGGTVEIGRFAAPVGYYSNTRLDNPTITFSSLYDFFTYTFMTGFKLNWAWDNGLNYQFYLVNSLYDNLPFGVSPIIGPRSPNNNSAVPSFGMRLGYNWGEEERASTIGLNFSAGPEQTNNGDWDYSSTLDMGLRFGQDGQWLWALEGAWLYRDLVGAGSAQLWGVDTILDYSFTEVWDFFFNAGYFQDFDGLATGFDQNIFNVGLGFGYQIHDNVKTKFQFDLRIHDYDVLPAGVSDNTSFSYGILWELGANF